MHKKNQLITFFICLLCVSMFPRMSYAAGVSLDSYAAALSWEGNINKDA